MRRLIFVATTLLTFIAGWFLSPQTDSLAQSTSCGYYVANLGNPVTSTSVTINITNGSSGGGPGPAGQYKVFLFPDEDSVPPNQQVTQTITKSASSGGITVQLNGANKETAFWDIHIQYLSGDITRDCAINGTTVVEIPAAPGGGNPPPGGGNPPPGGGAGCSFQAVGADDWNGFVKIQGEDFYYVSFFFHESGGLVEGSGWTFYWHSGLSSYKIPKISVLTVAGTYKLGIGKYPGNLSDFCSPLTGATFYYDPSHNGGGNPPPGGGNPPPGSDPVPPTPPTPCGGTSGGGCRLGDAPVDCSKTPDASTCKLGSLPGDSGTLKNIRDPLRGLTLGAIITNGFSSVLVFAGMLAVLIIIWGGFKYLTAQGDEKAVASARGTITGAIIGLVILLAIAVIGFIINAVLKINVFNAG